VCRPQSVPRSKRNVPFELPMLSFGVSNLRRLKLVPPIELKPITILVGRNSSGKSSFLRAFPLLRQSLMTRTSSPILWYGDLVDFGSFDISVSDDARDEPISFSFRIDELQMEDPSYYVRMINAARTPHKIDPVVHRGVHFTSSIIAAGGKTRISRLYVRIESAQIEYDILLGDDLQVLSVKLNGKDIYGLLGHIKLQITPGTVFPELIAVREEGKKEVPRRPLFSQGGEEFHQPIRSILESHIKNIEEPWLTVAIGALIHFSLSDKSTIQKGLRNVVPKELNNLVQDIYGADKRGLYSQLRDMLVLAALPAILSEIRSYLSVILRTTLYIGPARARSERYYRYQDLAVSEIDPDGKNFPMFLNSLTSYQINQFSRWIEELFGYGLRVSRQEGGGHMSIDLVYKGMAANIVDTGYGVSQILPVLGQIWWARNRSARRLEHAPAALLAIEQPELYLHPAHQALLADALVGEIKGSAGSSDSGIKPVSFLIETHSETLLNRLGELVGRGKMLFSDVQVILFEPLEDDDRRTDVKTSSFSETGELINWPYGFFQPTIR
jgi:AAA ATPase domain